VVCVLLLILGGVCISCADATPPQVKGINVDDVASNHLRWREALERYCQEHHVVPSLATLAGCFKDPPLRFASQAMFAPSHLCTCSAWSLLCPLCRRTEGDRMVITGDRPGSLLRPRLTAADRSCPRLTAADRSCLRLTAVARGMSPVWLLLLVLFLSCHVPCSSDALLQVVTRMGTLLDCMGKSVGGQARGEHVQGVRRLIASYFVGRAAVKWAPLPVPNPVPASRCPWRRRRPGISRAGSVSGPRWTR
jgi:hypothetical protein